MRSLGLATVAAFVMGAIAALSEPARAASHGCPEWNRGPAEVQVEILDAGVAYDFSRSSAEIAALAPMSGTHPNHGAVARGLTTASFESSFVASIAYFELRGGGVCVRPAQIQARFGHPTMVVYVQRDYPAGSCQSDRIVEHEAGHVRINRETFAQHLPAMVSALREAANHSAYPVWAADLESGRAAVAAHIQQALSPQIEALRVRRQAMHDQLDTPRSYQATQAACPSW